MPWKDKVKGILAGYIGGEAGGKAVVDCILGNVNPNGKLAETYPNKLEDTSCFNNYPGNEITVEYKESVYVGYKYYDKVGKDVLFPAGLVGRRFPERRILAGFPVFLLHLSGHGGR